MRKTLLGCIIVLGFATVVSSGCAKKDVVKSEEPTPSAQTAPPAAKPESARPGQQGIEPGQQIAETPTAEAPIKQEPAKETAAAPGATGIELQKVYFNFDSAALSDEARNALSKTSEQLAKQASISVRIEGNCDERGSDEYNLALGERRAKAARDYLVNLGVQPERLSVISYGEEKPADPGHDEAAWAKNRRDEFVIIK